MMVGESPCGAILFPSFSFPDPLRFVWVCGILRTDSTRILAILEFGKLPVFGIPSPVRRSLTILSAGVSNPIRG